MRVFRLDVCCDRTADAVIDAFQIIAGAGGCAAGGLGVARRYATGQAAGACGNSVTAGKGCHVGTIADASGGGRFLRLNACQTGRGRKADRIALVFGVDVDVVIGMDDCVVGDFGQRDVFLDGNGGGQRYRRLATDRERDQTAVSCLRTARIDQDIACCISRASKACGGALIEQVNGEGSREGTCAIREPQRSRSSYAAIIGAHGHGLHAFGRRADLGCRFDFRGGAGIEFVDDCGT